jgi:ABC-type Fe3+/spermidine/putrescine transport system ATPase subunit
MIPLASSFLELESVVRVHQGLPTLNGISLRVDAGHILCILGPSGCGKTTLLRVTAGIEPVDGGSVWIDGKNMNGVPVHLRNVGMVFQEFALFPHKTVFGNIAFGLEMSRWPRRLIEARVTELLELVGMPDHGDRRIDQLSGGQKQRVALCRSLAPNPRMLLLDEPMGSLDRELRERLVQDVGGILRNLNMTAVYVTHDHAEGFAVADRIAVMRGGEIRQMGTPEEIYHRPVDQETARFLGFENFLGGQIVPGGRVRTPIGEFQLPCKGHPIGETVTVLIRPEAATLTPVSLGNHSPGRWVTGIVRHRIFQGKSYGISLLTEEGYKLSFDLPLYPFPPSVDSPISLWIQSYGIEIL